MTHAQLSGHIGRSGTWIVGQGIQFRVTVEDAREVFGRLDYKIRPVAGNGWTWTAADRVQLDPEPGQ